MTPHSGGYSGHPRDVLRQEIVRADRQVSLNCTAFISGEGMAWGGTEGDRRGSCIHTYAPTENP